MGAPEVKASDAARPVVARFLWETNSELDDPVVDYLSEIIFEEAMQHKNGKSTQAVTENLHLFIPMLRMDGLEARVQGLLEQIRCNAAAGKPKDEYRDYWTSNFSPSSSSLSLNPAMKRTLSAVSTHSSASSAELSNASLVAPVPKSVGGKGEGKSTPPFGGLSRPASSCSVTSRGSDQDEKKELLAKDLSATSVESSYVPGGTLSAVGENGDEAKGVPVPVKGPKNLWGPGGLAGLDSLGFTGFNVSESAPGKIETSRLLGEQAQKQLPEGSFENEGLARVKDGVKADRDIFECSPKSPLSNITSPSSLESLSKNEAFGGLAVAQAQRPGSKNRSQASSSDEEEGGKNEGQIQGGAEKEWRRGSPWDEHSGLTSLQLAALSLNPNAAEFVPPQGGKSESEKGSSQGPFSESPGSEGVEIPAISAPRKGDAEPSFGGLPEDFHFGEESLPRDLLKMSDEMVFGASLARGGSPSTLSGGSHSPGAQSRGFPPGAFDDALRGAEMNRSISMSSMRGERGGLPIRVPEDGRRSQEDLRRAQFEADRRLQDDLARLPPLAMDLPAEEGRFDPRLRMGRTLPEHSTPFPPDFSPRESPLFHRRGSEGSLGIPPSPRRDPMFGPSFRAPPLDHHSPPGGSPRFALGPSPPTGPPPFVNRTPSRENLRGPPPFGFNRPFDGPPPLDYMGEPPARPGFGEFFDARGRYEDGPPHRFDRGFDHAPFPSPRGMRPDFIRPDFDPAFGPRGFGRGFVSPRGPPPPHAFDFPPSPMRGGGMRGPPIEETGPDPVQVLAAEFPGFPAEGLAEIFFSNGCDLALTMEMLTQLEVQEGNSAVRRRQPPPPPPSLGMNDFPALGGGEPPFPSHREAREADVQDFAAAVRKAAAAQNAPSRWAYDAPPPRRSDFPVGIPRGEAPPPWLETGDAVAGMYGQLRDEARDYARARNACFEQATAAYLAGNKALAKQLSAKGQWHNERMKAAHARAGEAIFAERNPRRAGDPPMLDLHGLHVAEAILILKRELAALKAQAAHTRQRQQICVVVGTGHHTKGARTPARLPLAVEQFLQEERVNFSEPQPGLLRVLV